MIFDKLFKKSDDKDTNNDEIIKIAKSLPGNAFEVAEQLKTDLVQASYYFCCDEETAKYRGRVFSISGKDKRFPKLTEDVLKCNLGFSAYVYGITTFLVYDKKEYPIKFSNRPFVDDRTDEEKEIYEKKYKNKEKRTRNNKD